MRALGHHAINSGLISSVHFIHRKPINSLSYSKLCLPTVSLRILHPLAANDKFSIFFGTFVKFSSFKVDQGSGFVWIICQIAAVTWKDYANTSL